MNENAVILSAEGNTFVDQKWSYLAEMISDYNSSLELRWIPTDKRSPQDRSKPYIVVHTDKDNKEYIVLYASDLDTPEEIMTRLISSDMKHGNVMSRMDIRNNVQKLFEMRAKEDELAQQEDLARWLTETTKTNPTFRNDEGELIKLDSQLNRVQHKKVM
jgi:hypothetical protein